MVDKRRHRHRLTNAETDSLVAAQANNDSAWTAPIRVRRGKSVQLRLPGAMAARISFLSRLHHAKNPSDWVENVLRERLDFEESALGELKQALKTSS